MKQTTTRIVTIEITEVIEGKVNMTKEEVQAMFTEKLSNYDDVHVTVQDFEMEEK